MVWILLPFMSRSCTLSILIKFVEFKSHTCLPMNSNKMLLRFFCVCAQFNGASISAFISIPLGTDQKINKVEISKYQERINDLLEVPREKKWKQRPKSCSDQSKCQRGKLQVKEPSLCYQCRH